MAATFLLLFLAAVAVTTATAETIDSTTALQDLESMLNTLRSRGYTLFSNAITTTDLQYQLLTTAAAEDANRTTSFTLFCPKDSHLFALDMASDANVYVSTLQYHVLPHRRLTFADLRNLSASFLDTLLPHYSVLIGKTQNDSTTSFDGSNGVMVDGVRVSDPDLFVGSRIVVHGIDGVLVTGLNRYSEDLGEEEIGNHGLASGIPMTSPVEFLAPTTPVDRNIPVVPNGNLGPMTSDEETLALLAQLAWNIPVEEPTLSPIKKKKGDKPRQIRRKSHHRRHHSNYL